MPESLSVDPFALDRALALAAKRHTSFLAALRAGTDAEHAFESLPVGLDAELCRVLRERGGLGVGAGAGAVAGGAGGAVGGAGTGARGGGVEATGAMSGGMGEIDAASARWLAFLLVEHASIELRRAEARALRVERHALETTRVRMMIAEIVERTLSDAGRRELWFAELGRVAPTLAERRFELWEYQAERYAELGMTPIPLGDDSAQVCDAARALLAATDDAWESLRIDSLPRLVELGLGTDVPGDWPARMSERRLSEFFREGGWFEGITPEIGALPVVYGASSVLRVFDRFGRAWHDAGASRSRPFAIAHGVRGVRRATFGALFALLPTMPSFARARLDVARVHSTDCARALSRVLLAAVRVMALRALLAAAAYSGRTAYARAFAEEGARGLGVKLSPSFAGAVFVRGDCIAGYSGLLDAAVRFDALVERHDEDWFRNPRAIEELRHECDANPGNATNTEATEAGLAALASVVVRGL